MNFLGKMLYQLTIDCASRPVLRDAVSARPLYQVLGGYLAGAKVNTERTELLNRLYHRLSWYDQQRCRVAMLEYREARRRYLLAGTGSRAEYVA